MSVVSARRDGTASDGYYRDEVVAHHHIAATVARSLQHDFLAPAIVAIKGVALIIAMTMILGQAPVHWRRLGRACRARADCSSPCRRGRSRGLLRAMPAPDADFLPAKNVAHAPFANS